MKVNLTSQEIVKFAYVTKEIIEAVWGKKISAAQANCYIECFYTVQELLESVDRNYLKKHASLVDFFLTGRRLNSDKDVLMWEKKWKISTQD